MRSKTGAKGKKVTVKAKDAGGWVVKNLNIRGPFFFFLNKCAASSQCDFVAGKLRAILDTMVAFGMEFLICRHYFGLAE